VFKVNTVFSPQTEWSVSKNSQSSLTLRTVHPIAAWSFEISSDYLKISNTLCQRSHHGRSASPVESNTDTPS
jgi:hypothetical protein